MNEHATIQAVQKGRREQYRSLVERYHVGLIIHCERLVGSRDDAEDIAQEAFIKAYTQIARFDPAKGRFSTWLYRIATNLAIDWLRRNRRTTTVDEIEQLAEATQPVALAELQKQELRRAVLALVPPPLRRAVEAFYWEGMSYQAISQELGVPIGTVRTWLHRAKRQLKEALS